MRTESTPLGKFAEQFNAMFWQSSPYSLAGGGLAVRHSFDHQGAADEFYRRTMAPQIITLVLVGDFQPERVLALARQYSSGFRGGQRMRRMCVTLEVKQDAEQRNASPRRIPTRRWRSSGIRFRSGTGMCMRCRFSGKSFQPGRGGCTRTWCWGRRLQLRLTRGKVRKSMRAISWRVGR